MIQFIRLAQFNEIIFLEVAKLLSIHKKRMPNSIETIDLIGNCIKPGVHRHHLDAGVQFS